MKITVTDLASGLTETKAFVSDEDLAAFIATWFRYDEVAVHVATIKQGLTVFVGGDWLAFRKVGK